MQELPLISIEQSINTYKSLHEPMPSFGMDIYADDFDPHGLVILQNNGKGSTGVPIRCNHYVLVLTLKGGSIRHINQYEYRVGAHAIQLLVPGVIHSFEDTQDNSDFFVLLFDREFLTEEFEELFTFHQDHPQYVDLEGLAFAKILSLFEQINLEYKNKEEGYFDLSRSLLTQLLYLLKRGKLAKPREVIQNRSEQITSNFLCLIEQHFQKIKTVQGYADILELSPKHLSETIKEALDKTALYFIHQRLIKEIQFLLVYSDLSIKKISSGLNFENSSQMGRFFKRYEEISPRNYQLRHKKLV
ncbi:AraC family transcriptional regulator [Sulfurimonas sp. MAG313]|nr:helix-turn-helix domain-containing protein [Sulfurimonas sp. MAG313]MDF1881982.1 AraC family transcriptional regulator [Sulfurimonas sp. MAG313]